MFESINKVLLYLNINSFGAKFQTTFVVCFLFFFFFFFFFLFFCFSFYFTNYRLERRSYVKLTDRMSNSVDPDETAHLDLCCLLPIIIACDRVN